MGVPAEGVLSAEDMIVISCQEYGIEPDIPLAIAGLETGNFQSEGFRRCNNFGGLSENENLFTYKSKQEGVDKFVRLLAVSYFGEGLTTVEEISQKYCPGHAEAWAGAVRKIMEEEKYDKL